MSAHILGMVWDLTNSLLPCTSAEVSSQGRRLLLAHVTTHGTSRGSHDWSLQDSLHTHCVSVKAPSISERSRTYMTVLIWR